MHLTVTFATPLLPDDLMILSRPLTYLNWDAKAIDGKTHDVSFYVDANAELAVNVPTQIVTAQRSRSGGLTLLRVGTVEQPILEARGDDQRIDWGYFYLASKSTDASILAAADAHAEFAKSGTLGEKKIEAMKEGVAAKDAPVLAIAMKLGNVSEDVKSTQVLLAYDDIKSVRYFNNELVGYWKKDGMKIDELLFAADRDYASIAKRCSAFDEELVADMRKLGGDSYVQIGVLAYRQSLAAQKVVADANGKPISFSKENFSNGCMGTVDVLYPASPLMMAFSPNLLKASLRPLMDYSASPRWKHDSAPHDIGTYPHATGQVYGGGDSDSGMPVEETGNMLCMIASLAKIEGNADFAKDYWPTITKWANYLKNNGFDPGNQLTTDDFAGHIARNTNLAAKAIEGVASYAMLADMLGKKEDAKQWTAIAKQGAVKWMEMGAQGDHYGLVFGDKGKGTWSQKYNLVWDKILELHVFPQEVFDKEWAFYRTKMNAFGLPLDSRETYTKLDWELWTAALSDKPEDMKMIVDPIAKFLNETPDRVPMTDWYWTQNGKHRGFQARSVVGGVFISFLKDSELWKKYASRDKTSYSGWAEVDYSPPKKVVVIPAADVQASVWQYTTDKPSDDWFALAFSAKDWKSGKGGFGGGGAPGAKVGTPWSTNNIWLRREVTLPDRDLKNVNLWMYHDEDVTVYINGVRAAHVGGFTAEYTLVRLNNAGRAALKRGKNLIAVHCSQTSGGQFIDLGIVELVIGSNH